MGSGRRRRSTKVASGKRAAPGRDHIFGIRAPEVRDEFVAPLQGAPNVGRWIQARRDLRSLAPGYLLTAPPALRSHDASSMSLPLKGRAKFSRRSATKPNPL